MRILGLPQACCFSVLALILIYVAVNTASRSRRNGSRRGTAPATSFATYFVASFRHGALEPPGPQPADNACQRMEVVIFSTLLLLFRRILAGDMVNVCHPSKASHIIVVSVGGDENANNGRAFLVS